MYSFFFILYSILVQFTLIRQNEFERYQASYKTMYTYYCDIEGHPIHVGSNVYYQGLEHEVIKDEKEYRIRPLNERGVFRKSDLITLKEAAENESGRLRLKKV